MTERSYVLPSETLDDQASRRAALAIMRRFVGDRAGMWTALEMAGVDDAATELIREHALKRDLSVPPIPGHQPEPADSRASQPGHGNEPKPDTCRGAVKHIRTETNVRKRRDGRFECTDCEKIRRRARKAKRAAA